MKYLDVYPGCEGCPAYKYCGTMTSKTQCCNEYGNATPQPVDFTVKPTIIE